MKTILHAEDERTDRAVVKHALEAVGYRVVQASDGVEARELAIREPPDLLVLDWMMPKLSGIGLLRALRDHPATRDIPIMMLTGKKIPMASQRCARWVYRSTSRSRSPLQLWSTESIQCSAEGPSRV